MLARMLGRSVHTGLGQSLHSFNKIVMGLTTTPLLASLRDFRPPLQVGLASL